MTGVVDAVDVAVEVFGGLVTQLAPADLPHGVSPDCQDLQFSIGSVKTRPGLVALYTLAGSALINYMKTYENLQEVPRFLFLDSLGALRRDTTPGSAGVTVISPNIIPGSFCRSSSLFAREYFGFNNGTEGLDMPRQYDDTNFDRVSQCGPGAAPTVGDSGTSGNISAGTHQLTVIFVTRNGYYTRPAPPTSWSAAGSKQAAVTNIPIGPPNVVARVLSFTAVAQASFYHLGPLGLTLANSNMYIADNTTTSLTVDFTDEILLLGTLDDPLFTQIVLPPVAGFFSYSNRLFGWAGQENIQNMLNLPFDGGFGKSGGAPTPTSSGPFTGTAAADGGGPLTPWNNPLNALSNASDATNLANASSATNYLQATGFGPSLNLPSNATVTGIQVIWTVHSLGSVNFTDQSSLLILPTLGLSGVEHRNGAVWPLGYTNEVYGGPGDTWGLTVTPAQINDPAFGAAISALNLNSGGAHNCGIKYVTIEVFFTVPVAGATVGPLGWTQGGTYAGGGSALNAGYSALFGDAFAITGDGATAQRGLITQSAFTDYLLNPILLPNTSYGVRVRVANANNLMAGTLHVNLQSTNAGFTTPGVAVQAVQTTSKYQAFSAVLTAALNVVPADLLLQVYADATPTNGGVFLVDEIEIYPLNAQWENSTIRASKGQLATQGQESFDSETGQIQYNLNDGQSVRNLFQIRERMYIVKEHSFGVTQDDGVNEPSNWSITDVTKAVGTPSINGVGLGEDWVVIAHRTGLYLFWGGGVEKISEEIQPTWDSINWQYGSTISVSVDIRTRRIYVCAPFGPSTIPNQTLVLDYHDVGSDASDIAANPPIHLTYTGNKKAFDRARKWSPWTVKANSVAQIELTTGETGCYFGSNDGSGDVNVLDTTGSVFTDNGATIPSYYVMAFFVEQIQEQPLQLGSHRKLFTYLTMYIQGIGTVGVTVYLASLSNAIALNPQTLNNPAFKDTEMMINQLIERMAVKVASQGNGQFFDLQRMCLSVKKDPWAQVRGSN